MSEYYERINDKNFESVQINGIGMIDFIG